MNIDKEKLKTLKKLYNKKIKMAVEWQKINQEFGSLQVEIFGNEFNNFANMDDCVDTLDYGIGLFISFDEFVSRMIKNAEGDTDW